VVTPLLLLLHRGLILQDLTFVHIGNPDKFPDGNINFAKCWQHFTILDNMRRFKNWFVPLGNSLVSVLELPWFVSVLELPLFVSVLELFATWSLKLSSSTLSLKITYKLFLKLYSTLSSKLSCTLSLLVTGVRVTGAWLESPILCDYSPLLVCSSLMIFLKSTNCRS